MYVVTAASSSFVVHFAFFWPPFLHHASPFLCSSSSPSRTADNTSGHSASGFWTAAPSLFFSFLQPFFSTTVFVKRCEINRCITKSLRMDLLVNWDQLARFNFNSNQIRFVGGRGPNKANVK